MERVHPQQLFPQILGSAMLAPVLCLDVEIPAGPPGVRDVSIFTANAPHNLSVLSAMWTAVTPGPAMSTGQLRTGPGGGGSALSGPIPLDTPGRALEGPGGSLVSLTAVVRDSNMVFRMSDGLAAGRLIVFYRRTA